MELFELLPGKVGDLQRVPTRDNRVRVIRENVVLKVLREHSRIICLKRNILVRPKILGKSYVIITILKSFRGRGGGGDIIEQN